MRSFLAIAALLLLAFVSFASSSSPPVSTVVALTRQETIPLQAAAVPGVLVAIPDTESAWHPVLEPGVPFEPDRIRPVALSSGRVGSEAEGGPAVIDIPASVVRQDALAAAFAGIPRRTQGGRITPASIGAA